MFGVMSPSTLRRCRPSSNLKEMEYAFLFSMSYSVANNYVQKWSKLVEEDVYDEMKLTAFVKTETKCCD